MKLKLIILSSLVVFTFLFSACGNVQSGNPAGARLQIDTLVNMGDFEGPMYKKFTKIPYKNVGTDTLYILGCMGTCDCTELVVSDTIVPPGGSGVITAYLDLTDKPWHTVEQPFFVLTNDPVRRQTDVVLVGQKK